MPESPEQIAADKLAEQSGADNPEAEALADEKAREEEETQNG